jgi:hypothetical protein
MSRDGSEDRSIFSGELAVVPTSSCDAVVGPEEETTCGPSGFDRSLTIGSKVSLLSLPTPPPPDGDLRGGSAGTDGGRSAGDGGLLFDGPSPVDRRATREETTNVRARVVVVVDDDSKDRREVWDVA